MTVEGDTTTETNVAGVMVSPADFAAAPFPAVIRGVVCVLTADVFTVNVAKLEPPAMETVAGTTALALFDRSPTVMPPVGAGPESVIVAVVEFPPCTEVGLTVSPLTDRLLTFSGAVTVTPSDVALTATVVLLDSVSVVIVNVPWVAPGAILTVPGTPTVVFPLRRMMPLPPAGAGLERVTVPVELVPPMTVCGLIVRRLTATLS